MGQSQKGRKSFVQAPDPTPSEIRRLCLQIQAGWSERERRCRAGVKGEQRPVELQRFDDGVGMADGSV